MEGSADAFGVDDTEEGAEKDEPPKDNQECPDVNLVIESITVDELIETAGAEGWYQYRLFLYAAFISFFMPVASSAFPLIYALPEYRCFIREGELDTQICNAEEAKAAPFGFKKHYPRRSMLAAPKASPTRYQRSSLFYQIFIAAVGLALLGGLARAGRRWGYLASLAMVAAGGLLGLITDNSLIVPLALASAACGCEVFYSASGPHVNESMSEKIGTRSASVLFFLYSIGSIAFFGLNSILLNYWHIYSIMLVGAAIALIAYPFCVLESPHFCAAISDFSALRRTLLSISEANHKPNEHKIAAERIENGVKTLSHAPPRPTQWRKFGFRFAALTVIAANINFVSMALGAALQLIPGASLYTTGMLINCTEMLTYFVMSIAVDRAPRRATNAIIAAFFVFASAILCAADWIGDRGALSKRLPQITCLLIDAASCVGAAIMPAYVVELLPGELRGWAFAASFGVGRVYSVAFAPFMDKVAARGWNPISGIALTSIFAFLFAVLLPETVERSNFK